MTGMNLNRRAAPQAARATGQGFPARRANRLWRRRAVAAAVSALMLASAGVEGVAQKTAPPRAAEQPIWSGTSAGYAIQWTTADLSARPTAGAAGAVFSARQMARQDFANIEKESDTPCEYERTFKLLSVVGSII